MAWEKVVRRINWENEPSTATPIDEDNLNMGDYALNVHDDRIIELGNRTANLEGYEARVAVLEQEARDSRDKAKESEEKALQSELNAKESEETADDWKKLAESHNHGGTGVREGEDTDNAKYWAHMAEQSAHEAGFMSFEIKDDGCLWYARTESIVEKIKFAIVGDGNLEVRVYG